MYKIIRKKSLNPYVTQMEILAPLVANKAKAGQFIILRVDEVGERIPLTIAGADKNEGSVKIIFQIVGKTTSLLNEKNEGDYILDFVGPLGVPTNTDSIKNVLIIGGGVGCAIALPVALEFKKLGANVSGIIGFRNKDLVILEDEFSSCCDNLTVVTDDGSYGIKGKVTNPLKELLDSKKQIDQIIAIGPLVMMKFVVLTAKPYNVPVTVSMNPIMIDGTGMCGGCRLTLNKDGKKITKFACVDGPDFNGYEVDFDDAISRSSMYRDFERHAYEENCNLFNKRSE